MFASAKLDAEYKPLSGAEDSTGQGPPPQRDDQPFWGRRSRYSSIIHFAIIGIELILFAVLIAGSMCLDNARRALSIGPSFDGLAALGAYNTTMRFENNSYLLSDTEEAKLYWRDLLGSGGVVSLNTEWAKEQGLRPSAMSPTDSSQSIYQVDVYHALHCMNAIRENLVSKTPPAWDEVHVLHCLDYVRHQLICHPDLTLTTTNDLEEFVLDETHTCRDYGALVDWVDRNRWVEFPEWLESKSKHQS